MRPKWLAVALACSAGLGSIAHANPRLEIASAADEGDPLDINVGVEYVFTSERAAIKREFAGYPGTDPDGPMPSTRSTR